MATGSRDLNLDEPRTSIGRLRTVKPPPKGEIVRAGAAGLELANDLLGRSVVSIDIAEQAIERLRQGARAIEATFWVLTDASARCVVRVGDHALGDPLPTLPLKGHRMVSERLRRRAVVLCRAGEVTGVEDLLPAAANSYAVLSCVNDGGVTGALALGWDAADPPVDVTAVSHLQIAVGALLRTLPLESPRDLSLNDAIVARRQAERALGEMGSRVVAAQEDERRRIARELHDDIGQQTALIAARIETLLRSSALSTAHLRDDLVSLQQTVQDLAISIHNLSHELHPPKLRLLGLVKTLESLCRNVSKESPIRVSFRSTAMPLGVPEHISLCICRVAQEALQNAVKHSGARDVEMELDATESALLLRVSDSGRGFDPLTATDTGIGLITMRDRVELNGGRLQIHASPSGGATIEATVPFVASF